MIEGYELKAFLKEGNQQRPFYLRISEPEKVEDADDYFCYVHAPELFRKNKIIIGVSRDQARDLALNFVKSVLGEKCLVDEKGQSITL